MLREAAVQFRFTLLECGRNLGIATGLNLGIRHAASLGCQWVLLLDQDSCVTDGFVTTLLVCFAQSRWGTRLALLVPRYLDMRFGTALPANHVKEGLEAAMTSGSLLRIETFARHGYFVDELFIDGVDYEYSLRLRAAGLVIEECSEAVLLHSPGQPGFHKFFGFRYQTANYSPVRRYYQERNKIWISKRYLTRFPLFCFKLFFFSSKDLVKLVVAETESWRKVTAFLAGIRDGILGRTGRKRM